MVVQKQVYIKQGSTINRVRNESLITSIHKQYIGDSIRQKIDGKLTLEVGKPASLKLYCNESTYTAYSKEIVEQAQNRPMERERIVSQIEKLGNTPFVFETLDIKMDEAIFLSIKTLNDLRREAVSGLCEALSGKYYRKTTDEKKEKRIAAEVIEEKNNTYDQFKRKENFSIRFSWKIKNSFRQSAPIWRKEKRRI